MNRTMFSMPRSVLASIILGLAVVGCGNDVTSPPFDQQGVIDPSNDKDGVLNGLTIDGAVRSNDTMPQPSNTPGAPFISLDGVEIAGVVIREPGSLAATARGRTTPDLSLLACSGSEPMRALTATAGDYQLVRIRPGQRMTPAISIAPAVQSTSDAVINLTVEGATGYYKIGDRNMLTSAKAKIPILVRSDFRPGTFSILINFTDKRTRLTSNIVRIDVVVENAPSADPKTLLPGAWRVVDQRPLPPLFPTDYRGELDTFRVDGTFASKGATDTYAVGRYVVELYQGKPVVRFSEVRLIAPIPSPPLPGATYEIVSLNSTRMILTEIGGAGRFLVFDRQ